MIIHKFKIKKKNIFLDLIISYISYLNILICHLAKLRNSKREFSFHGKILDASMISYSRLKIHL